MPGCPPGFQAFKSSETSGKTSTKHNWVRGDGRALHLLHKGKQKQQRPQTPSKLARTCGVAGDLWTVFTCVKCNVGWDNTNSW